MDPSVTTDPQNKKPTAMLNLNAEQTAQVEKTFADILKKMEPIQASWTATHDQLKGLRSASPTDAEAIQAKESELDTFGTQKRALFAKRDNALQKILTPEQFAKFQEIATAHAQKHMGTGHQK